jgi:hypothetical protein
MTGYRRLQIEQKYGLDSATLLPEPRRTELNFLGISIYILTSAEKECFLKIPDTWDVSRGSKLDGWEL